LGISSVRHGAACMHVCVCMLDRAGKKRA
jgi:hypothetical protein